MVSNTDDVLTEMPSVTPKETTAVPVDLTNITDQDIDKAQKLFQLGKKNLFLNKYDESVNNIGEACDIYSAKYGELDTHCAEVYFFYGRALLELARVENTVLGNALNGVPEETASAAPANGINDSRYGNPDDVEEAEKKEISEQVIDALCENKESAATTSTIETPKETATTEEKPKEAIEEKPTVPPTEEKPSTSTEATSSKEKPAAENGGEEEEDDDEDDEDDDEDVDEDEKAKDEAEAEDISNLQRSWEMFELAKVIYTKHFVGDEALKQKRIAECLMKLGEIGIEQELYEQACIDILESIRLQEDVVDKESRDERMLAETYYQLGLAYQFSNKFKPEAYDAFQRCMSIVQLRVEKLKGKLDAAKEATGEDAELEKNTWREEISDLETLLPEMSSKLEECHEQTQQQSAQLIKEVKECFTATTTTEPDTTPSTEPAVNGSAEVKDITQLVKSKRKLNETEPTTTGTTKKTRLSTDPEETTPVITEPTTTTVTTMDATPTETTTPAPPVTEEAPKPIVEAKLPEAEIAKEIQSATATTTDVELKEQC